MRDPARRERILKLIETIWMHPQNADTRLYQLLGNAANMHQDPYFYEDDKLEADLQAVVDRLGVT